MRSLKDVRGLRRFICRVIIEMKAGLLSVDVARTLIYGASRAALLDQAQLLDQRVSALEARLAAAPAHRPNGSDHHAAGARA
jgi:hypothetical protein